MSLSEFELSLLDALLSGDHPELATLREQFEVADVTGREVTETGFKTFFKVKPGAPKVEDLDAIDDLQLDLAGAKTPADAVLHIKGGRLQSLECYVYDGTFPADPEITAAWYYGTEKFPGITDELIEARDVAGAVDDEGGQGDEDEGDDIGDEVS